MLNSLTQPGAATTTPETSAWTDMLARIGEKQVRLARLTDSLPANGAKARRRNSWLGQVEKERARIARDLHAGAGQPLAGIKINLEVLDGYWDSMPQEARDAVAAVNRLADAALGQVRAVSHRLHPPAWQGLSLEQALRSVVEESGIKRKCSTELSLDPLPLEPDHAAKVVLYRCAQECISNVLRHSHATEFALSLGDLNGMIRMEVRDNGQGIPSDAGKNGGIGLAALREHVESVDGTLAISSGPGGTTVRILVPGPEN